MLFFSSCLFAGLDLKVRDYCQVDTLAFRVGLEDSLLKDYFN